MCEDLIVRMIRCRSVARSPESAFLVKRIFVFARDLREKPDGCLAWTAILSRHRHTVIPAVDAYFTGILITIAPMISLILKSRLGLSGWELWQPMQAWATARSG